MPVQILHGSCLNKSMHGLKLCYIAFEAVIRVYTNCPTNICIQYGAAPGSQVAPL